MEGYGILATIFIGAVAGWVASKITEERHGLITRIVVGVIGAFVGGRLADVLNTPVHGLFGTMIASIIGAVIVLYLWRVVRAPRSPS
jgi:uncharacterized membrane protein YeaQ/YmgE (transglycosylase-associated protein family)